MKESKFIYRVKNGVFTWLSGLLLLLFLGTSCSEEENGNSILTDDIESPVFFEVNTRAFGSGDKQVNTVRVIVAKQDHEGTIISNIFFLDPKTPTLTIQAKSGICDVFVIANEMDDNTELAALRDVKTIMGLQQINTSYNISKRKATNLPMAGEVRSVYIRSVGGVPSSSNLSKVNVDGVESSFLEVKVNRLAVKVDLTLMSQGFAELESVKITNIPDSVSLLGESYEVAVGGRSQVLEVNDWLASTPLTGYVWDKSRREIYLPSYLFSPLTAAAKAIKLEVKLVGQENANIVSLGHLMNEKTEFADYTLHPNTHYTFTGRMLGDAFTITAAIADWELKNQDYPTGGGEWISQPTANVRIGINKAVADTAKFEAVFVPGPVSYNWYRKYQIYNPTSNKIETIVQPLKNVESDTLTIRGAYESNLSIATKKISISGEIYCIASTMSPDNTAERSESSHVTLMVVGENYKWARGSFPSMQSFKAPLNAPLGSTCILQDDRDNNLYHAKLMADGNWWMIQDLAYGKVVSESVFNANSLRTDITNLIETGLYGVAVASGFSTGGHLYNTFAPIQLGPSTYEGLDNEEGLQEIYIQGICPEGWHFPGNLNGKYNEEWVTFRTMTKINLNTYIDFGLFGYNEPSSFNAYTISGEYANSLFLAGGCAVIQDGFSGEPEFRSLSIRANENSRFAGISTTNDISQSNKGTVKLSVRCLKNYK